MFKLGYGRWAMCILVRDILYNSGDFFCYVYVPNPCLPLKELIGEVSNSELVVLGCIAVGLQEASCTIHGNEGLVMSDV